MCVHEKYFSTLLKRNVFTSKHMSYTMTVILARLLLLLPFVNFTLPLNLCQKAGVSVAYSFPLHYDVLLLLLLRFVHRGKVPRRLFIFGCPGPFALAA